jgi:hypothetical protein
LRCQTAVISFCENIGKTLARPDPVALDHKQALGLWKESARFVGL